VRKALPFARWRSLTKAGRWLRVLKTNGAVTRQRGDGGRGGDRGPTGGGGAA